MVETSALSTEPKCLWTPKNPENTQMERFRAHVNKKYNLNLGKKKLHQP